MMSRLTLAPTKCHLTSPNLADIAHERGEAVCASVLCAHAVGVVGKAISNMSRVQHHVVDHTPAISGWTRKNPQHCGYGCSGSRN